MSEDQVYKIFKNIIKLDQSMSVLYYGIDSSDFFTRDEDKNINSVFDKCRYKRYPHKTCAIIGDKPFGNIEPSAELCEKYKDKVERLKARYFEFLHKAECIEDAQKTVENYLDQMSMLNVSFINDILKEKENNVEHERPKEEME